MKVLAEERKTEFDVDNSKMNDVQQFIERARNYTHIKELSPAIVNEFVDRIIISQKQTIDSNTVYPIDIFYRGVGIIDMPTAEEMEALFQEHIQQKRVSKGKTA